MNRQNLLGTQIFKLETYNSLLLLQQYYENGSIENYDLTNSKDSSSQLSLLIDISNSLRELSNLSIYHSNLKPSNLILNDEGHLLVSDYCKTFLYLNNPNISISPKTYEYLSPEIIKCESYNESSDIWSYGCLIYYVYNGESPFYNSSLFIMLNNIITLQYKLTENESNQHINNLILQMLKLNPNERVNIDSIVIQLNSILNKSFHQLSSISMDEIDNILNEGKCLNYDQLEEISQRQSIFKIYIIKIDLLKNIINLYNTTKESKYFYILVNLCLMYNNNLKKYIISRIKCEYKSIDSKIFNGINEGYTLYLVWKDITFQQIIYLFDNFYYLSILKGLYLYNITITDEGVKYLSNNLKYLPDLLGLYLYSIF